MCCLFFTISYIVGISDKIKNFIKGINVTSMAYKDINKLKFITKQTSNIPY